MGNQITYSSAPVTDLCVETGKHFDFVYAVASIQGWRKKQEDAFKVIINFHNGISYLAVFDGHGGSEIAEFLKRHLHNYIKGFLEECDDIELALHSGFLSCDSSLRDPEIKAILNSMIENEDDAASRILKSHLLDVLGSESSADVAGPGPSGASSVVGTSSASSVVGTSGASNIVGTSGASSVVGTSGASGVVGTSSASGVVGTSSASGVVGTSVASGVVGTSGASNVVGRSGAANVAARRGASNEYTRDFTDPQLRGFGVFRNVRFIPRPSEAGRSSDARPDNPVSFGFAPGRVILQPTGYGRGPSGVSLRPSSAGSVPSSAGLGPISAGVGPISAGVGPSSAGSVPSSAGSVPSSAGSVPSSAGSVPSSAGSVPSSTGSVPSSTGLVPSSAGSGPSSAGSGPSSTSSGPSCADPGPSSADPGPSQGAPMPRPVAEDIESIQYLLNEELESSDSEDADFDVEDEESSSESTDEEMPLDAEALLTQEPGDLSGSTATIALVSQSKIFVANVGDSKCVLSRNGQAIDMSLDHSPHNPEELLRIRNAGGSVSADGRVNNLINLSRAFGDFKLKGPSGIPSEQPITAEPYIKSIDIERDDDFLVIASDGIWNSFSSQGLVDYINIRIKAGDCTLNTICEEIFKFIMPPKLSEDGTGCDNMTLLIVKLNTTDESNHLIEEESQNMEVTSSAESETDCEDAPMQEEPSSSTEVGSTSNVEKPAPAEIDSTSNEVDSTSTIIQPVPYQQIPVINLADPKEIEVVDLDP